MVGRCDLEALRLVRRSLIVVPGSVGGRALALEIDDLAGVAHDLGQLQDVLVGIGFIRGASGKPLGVIAQSLGSGLGGTEFVIAATLVVGLFVGDDPADRGEDLLHRRLLLLSRLTRHVFTSRELVALSGQLFALRRPGTPARNSTPHHHLAFNDLPSPIRRLRTSR